MSALVLRLVAYWSFALSLLILSVVCCTQKIFQRMIVSVRVREAIFLLTASTTRWLAFERSVWRWMVRMSLAKRVLLSIVLTLFTFYACLKCFSLRLIVTLRNALKWLRVNVLRLSSSAIPIFNRFSHFASRCWAMVRKTICSLINLLRKRVVMRFFSRALPTLSSFLKTEKKRETKLR